MANYFEQVRRKLEGYKHLGERTLEDGTLLIGKAMHIAPLAWNHKISQPLTDSEIAHLEKEMGCNIPGDYKEFLTTHSNGLGLFVSIFSLDGFRKRAGERY